MAATGAWMGLATESANASASTATANAAGGPTAGQRVQMAGTIGSGLARYLYTDAQASAAKADAAAERDASTQQAKLILRATERQRGAARAATAGSGARIDAFSLANEQEIVASGETDAAMAILSGKRRSSSLLLGAGYQRAAGMSAVAETLFEVSRQKSNWKGAKPEFFDGTTGDSSAYRLSTWPKS